MKPSHYNLFVRDGDRVHAVNFLSRAVLDLTPDAHRTYEALASGASPPDDPDLPAFTAVLRDKLFLLDDDFDELAYVRLGSSGSGSTPASSGW